MLSPSTSIYAVYKLYCTFYEQFRVRVRVGARVRVRVNATKCMDLQNVQHNLHNLHNLHNTGIYKARMCLSLYKVAMASCPHVHS